MFDRHAHAIWPFRSQSRISFEQSACADAFVLASLLGDEAYDHARQQVIAAMNKDNDGMWLTLHWDRVRRELRGLLGIEITGSGARREARGGL